METVREPFCCLTERAQVCSASCSQKIKTCILLVILLSTPPNPTHRQRLSEMLFLSSVIFGDLTYSVFFQNSDLHWKKWTTCWYVREKN